LTPYCNQYIFISSACVYDYSKPGIKSEDDIKVFKEWDYSIDKWECECFLSEMAEKKHFAYTIIRPCITYDDSRIPYGIVPPYGYHWTIVERILHDKPIIRWNGGVNRWSMMRVEDFSIALVGVLGNKDAYNQAFNICGDDSCSWNEVIECVEQIIDKKAVFYDISSEEFASLAPEMRGRIFGRSFDLICSNCKIKTLVPDFHKTYNLRSGLEKTIQSYKDNNFQRGIDYQYDADMDRIIRESCIIHRDKKFNFKHGFINYLGTATY
jgi:Nucleoside-diphosphate-sugar epimerases